MTVQCWHSLPGQWVERGPWQGSLASCPGGMPWQAVPHATAGSQVHPVKRACTELVGKMPTTDTWAKRPLPPGNPRRLLRLLPITGEPIVQAAVKPQSSVLKLLQEGSFQQILPIKPSISKPSRSSPAKAMFFRSWLQSSNRVASTRLRPLSDLSHNLAVWLLTQFSFCRRGNQSAVRGRNRRAPTARRQSSDDSRVSTNEGH